MFTHDPYQNYTNWGAYSTGATPFGLPYSPYAGQNPGAALSPGTGIPGYGGIHPQQLHAAQILAAQAAIQQQIQQLQQLQQLQQSQNPLLAAVQQNPMLSAALQNPFAAGVMQNPLLNPILAQAGVPGLQTHLPYPQIGQFAGQQPQTWVGQGGLGVGQPFANPQFGGIHPLFAQFGVRAGGY
jgi:hypothetical protein